MISKDVQENIGRITKEKQRANATAYHQQHFNIAELQDKILLLRESSRASLACDGTAQRDGSGASDANISAAAVGGSLGRTDGSTDAAATCEASVTSPVPSGSVSSKKRKLSPSFIKDYFVIPPPTAKVQSKLDRVRRQKTLMMRLIGARMVQRQRRSPLAAALAVNQTGRVMQVVLDLRVVVAANEAGRVLQVVDLSVVVQAQI